MSTITVKELAAPTGYDLKIAAGETLDLKSQGTVTMPTGSVLQVKQATFFDTMSSTLDSISVSVCKAFKTTNPITENLTANLPAFQKKSKQLVG